MTVDDTPSPGQLTVHDALAELHPAGWQAATTSPWGTLLHAVRPARPGTTVRAPCGAELDVPDGLVLWADADPERRCRRCSTAVARTGGQQ